MASHRMVCMLSTIWGVWVVSVMDLVDASYTKDGSLSRYNVLPAVPPANVIGFQSNHMCASKCGRQRYGSEKLTQSDVCVCICGCVCENTSVFFFLPAQLNALR